MKKNIHLEAVQVLEENNKKAKLRENIRKAREAKAFHKRIEKIMSKTCCAISNKWRVKHKLTTDYLLQNGIDGVQAIQQIREKVIEPYLNEISSLSSNICQTCYRETEQEKKDFSLLKKTVKETGHATN